MVTSNSFALNLEYRRVDLLIRQNVTAPFLILIISSLFLITTWEKIDHTLLIIGAAAWNLSGIARLIATLRWQHRKLQSPSIEDLNKWSLIVVLGCLVSGLALGAIGVLSRLYMGLEQQIFIGMMILGICAASIAVYAASLSSCMAILLPAMVPWTVAVIWTGSAWQMPALMVLYIGMLAWLAQNSNEYVRNSIQTNVDLHHNEEKLRLALESLAGVSWEWDPKSDSFAWDEGAEKILGPAALGVRSLEDALGQVVDEERAEVRTAFLAAPTEKIVDVEYRLRTDDGSYRYVALCGKAQSGCQDGKGVLTGIAWDITQRKSQEKVRFERDLFEKANHAKVMFLANVSHEIRTPLTTINGFAENILHDSDMPVRLKDRMGAVLRSGRYLASVVHDLLDLSTAEADSIYIQKSKVPLIEEINDSIHVVNSALAHKNLKLNVVYDSPMPDVIVSDATRVRQIFINLLSNAVKYTEQGGIEMRLSYDVVNGAGRLRVVVSDTGIGISDQDREKLFQPFARGDSMRVRQKMGSGLGLVLSRTLARRLGGDLRLLSSSIPTDSSSGGSAFELTIDAGICQTVRFLTEHQWTDPKVVESVAADNRLFHNRHILLVEDDEDIRWLLREFLESKGVHVEICVHGAEAVEKAFVSRFDAVLMDIKMPIMDGYQATRLLRQKGLRTPVVALTAHANSSEMMLCYQAGCDFYLSKPIDFANLEEVLSKCLEHEQRNDAHLENRSPLNGELR